MKMAGMWTHPDVPDELNYLTWVRVLVCRLRQATDDGLDGLGTVSVAFRKAVQMTIFLHASCLWRQKRGRLPVGCRGRT